MGISRRPNRARCFWNLGVISVFSILNKVSFWTEWQWCFMFVAEKYY